MSLCLTFVSFVVYLCDHFLPCLHFTFPDLLTVLSKTANGSQLLALDYVSHPAFSYISKSNGVIITI